jgi:uncharacterized membrane protein YdjX (TVP38/TMEM64 family)
MTVWTGLWRPLTLGVLAATCLAVVYASPLRELLLPEGLARLRAGLGQLGGWAPPVFVACCALGIGVGAPRLAFAALGGLAFGWVLGSLLAHLGTLGGCWIAYSWSRWLGRDWVERRMGNRTRRLMDHLRRRPLAVGLLIRVCPIGNNFATNLFFGLSPIATRHFLLGTVLGTLPQTVVYAVLGNSAADGSMALLAVGVLVLALLVAGYWWLGRRSALAADVALGLAGNGRRRAAAAQASSPSSPSTPITRPADHIGER